MYIDGNGERTITTIGDRLGPNGDDPLDWAWFDGAGTAAIIGGILVPAWSVEDVAAYVRTLGQ